MFSGRGASIKARREGKLGITLSEDTKRRMSEARLGVPSPRLGSKLSDETKQKISSPPPPLQGGSRGELNY